MIEEDEAIRYLSLFVATAIFIFTVFGILRITL